MGSLKKMRYILAAVLLAAALLLLLRPSSSIRTESKKLVLTDEESIDRIWIGDVYDSTELRRSGDAWLVNGREGANSVAVENLLYAASHFQVGAILSTLPEGISWKRGRIIFQREEKAMLSLEYYSAPGRFLIRGVHSGRYYDIQLPGRSMLELREVFVCHSGHYLEHVLISLLPSEIHTLEVHPAGALPFRFTMDEQGAFSCLLPEQDSVIPPDRLDETAIRLLFSYFTLIPYEYPLKEWLGALENTPGEEQWLATLSLRSREGETHHMELWSLPGEKPGKSHPFLAAVRHNDGSDLLVVKYIHLDVLIRPLQAYYVDKR